MIYEITNAGIKYESYTTGSQGQRFVLFPVIDDHTPEDIQQAKTELRENQHAFNVRHIWVTRNTWDTLNIFMTVYTKKNNKLNKKFHENLSNYSVKEWKRMIPPGSVL